MIDVLLRHITRGSTMRVALISSALIVSMPAFAQTASFTVLHSFAGDDGRWPTKGLSLGNDGLLYGTTSAGGTAENGTIFSISSVGAFNSLYSFSDSGGFPGSNAEGAGPAELALGADGKWYGTTSYAGPAGTGTVFQYESGKAPRVLHFFKGSDGAQPFVGLLPSSDGAFYGTTIQGGTNGGNDPGVVFKITSAGSLEVLHSLSSDGSEGVGPNATLVERADGRLLGTTTNGGTYGGGTLFSVDKTSGAYKVLYAFPDYLAGWENGAVVRGPDGAYYGTTRSGSPWGLVYRVDDSDAVTNVFSFPNDDIGSPIGSLVVGQDGAFYGQRQSGHIVGIEGAVYRLTPSGQMTSLHVFTGVDGDDPAGRLIELPGGRFYGVTRQGGAFNAGTVYKLVVGPATPASPVATARSGAVALRWDPAGFATSYNVYLAAESASEPPATTLTNLSSPEAVVGGLKAGTAYRFWVTAVNEAGESQKSAYATATPSAEHGGSGGGSFSLLYSALFGGLCFIRRRNLTTAR